MAEQGITENDVVILKKKFYFTDQNIDRNDPVQLNLLYNQAKEAILLGKNPCTQEEAAQFAAIQLQIQSGNHEPDKHKVGTLKIKEFIPPEYIKKKDMEKKIYHEHKKLQGLNELNAKLRYVQISRSLKSYGITFFLVKERAKRNKLVNALIGVTKSSIVKLDMETKEVITEWKLTQLRRWAASPNSFTLDFGDYAEAYYSVQTTEGEQISQLISGYIDIILKKRKEMEKVVVEDEIEETSVEEYIKPSKATNFVNVVNPGQKIASETRYMPTSNNAGSMRAGTVSEYSDIPDPQHPYMKEKEPEYIHQQRAFSAGVHASLAMLKHANQALHQPSNLPPVGDDPAAQAWKEQTIDVNTANIAAQISGHLASASSIMNNVSGGPEDYDYEVLQTDVSALTTNISQMIPALKLVAELSDDGDLLMNCALGLVRATTDLVTTCRHIAEGEAGMRSELHANGQNLARESAQILENIGRAELSHDEQMDLGNMATSVGKAVMELVANAKSVSKTVQDPETVATIVSDAKFAFETSANLIACVNTSLPTINAQECTDQLLEGSVMMREVVAMLANSAALSTNTMVVDNFMEAAQRVEEALAKLVDRGMVRLF